MYFCPSIFTVISSCTCERQGLRWNVLAFIVAVNVRLDVFCFCFSVGVFLFFIFSVAIIITAVFLIVNTGVSSYTRNTRPPPGSPSCLWHAGVSNVLFSALRIQLPTLSVWATDPPLLGCRLDPEPQPDLPCC